jgi:tRNA 2-thiouridine synthesizing protein A
MTQDAAMAEDDVLDLRGLKCPLPALLAKKALAVAAPSSVLVVLADDPLAVLDIPHMCHAEGHGVDAVTKTADHHIFTLRPAAAAALKDDP